MARPLNSDELGTKGENKLGELLVDARLKANKPDRDRLGWDAVISWPFDELEPLDGRPAPLACHIQLKTVWAGNESISLNLSTLEYIVKDARPGFILVLEVDDPGLSFVRGRLIHIADEFLAEILKRLRKARINPRPGAMEFDPSVAKWGKDLPAVTGAALKTAMEAAAPAGMAEYARLKRDQLAQLGFERGAMQLTTTIEAASEDELIDGFLGLRYLSITDAAQVETRFDIPIEIPGLPWDQETESAAVKIMPKRTDRCTILVERSSDGERLEMAGELFSVPQRLLGKDRLVLEARAALARIRLDVRERNGPPGGSITFASRDGLDRVKASAGDWRDFYRLSAWSIRDPITISIKGKRTSAPPPIIGAVDPKPDLAEAERCERCADAAAIGEWVMAAAQAPDTKFTWSELAQAAPDLASIRAMKLSPGNIAPLSFVTSGPFDGPVLPAYDMLYVNSVPLAGKRIAFAARTRVTASVEGAGISWVTGPMQLEMVRKIKDCQEALQKFRRDAQKFTGLKNCFGIGLEP